VLFEPQPEFTGLPREGFETFALPDRMARRRAIVQTIHPALTRLGDDLLRRLGPRTNLSLHRHLPRLDWPREYQPFCTWLALSQEAHGYQAGPQLNVGVHADHVSVRLGWDTSQSGFGRFEFLCRHGGAGESMIKVAAEGGLAFRVYAAAAWPQGSRLVFETPDAIDRSFDQASHRGVWWELGRRLELPEAIETVCSPELGTIAARDLERLLPLYERFAGDK
jgi:hypothetical protein